MFFFCFGMGDGDFGNNMGGEITFFGWLYQAETPVFLKDASQTNSSQVIVESEKGVRRAGLTF